MINSVGYTEDGQVFFTMNAMLDSAPSVVGHPTEVVEARLKEEEDEILKQLHRLHEHIGRWEESAAS